MDKPKNNSRRKFLENSLKLSIATTVGGVGLSVINSEINPIYC